MENLRMLIEELFLSLKLLESVAGLITDVVLVVLWLVVGFILIKISKAVTFRIIKAKSSNPRTITIAKLVANIVKYTIWFVILIIILNEVGVNIAPFVASAGVIGLAIGFGAQEIVKDFISGFFLILDDVVNVGNVIEVGSFKGEVLVIGLRTTRIKNFKGEIKVVNNGDMKNIVNFSKSNSMAIVDFGVSYKTELKDITKIMMEFEELSFSKYDKIIEKPKFVGITELDDSSINMRVIAKTETGAHYQIERDLRLDLVMFLVQNDIEIPFPQVVVHNA
jgi:small-conductance mechanosensitive channel